MKKISVLVSVLLTMMLVNVKEVRAEIKATNFEDTIKEEIKTYEGKSDYETFLKKLKDTDLSKYKESKDKVNVYIFRGNTCSYCLKAITYFTSIVEKYGQYFNLVTYEVWQNTDNANLMNDVASVFNEKANGVPYIVIGDKTFNGYSETMNSDIETQIKKAFESKEKYDVMDNLGTKKETSNNSSETSNQIWIWMGLLASVVGIIVYVNYKNKQTKIFVLEEITKLKKVDKVKAKK